MTPAQNIQSLIGDETRKQRRRECHNQVEKRRREHINAMIEELNKLLPSKFKMPLEAEVAIEDEDEEEATADSPIKKKVSCLRLPYGHDHWLTCMLRRPSVRRLPRSSRRTLPSARAAFSVTAFSTFGEHMSLATPQPT